MVALLRRLAYTTAFFCMLQSSPAAALGLIQAYEAALQNDPGYRVAVYENQAGQQYRLLGRSNLLPNLSASYSNGKNKADITNKSVFGPSTTVQRDYTSVTGVIQLRQPLVNMEGIARYYQGVAQTGYSGAQFAARSQDLIIRLVGAYADAKLAEENLALLTVQRDTYAEQQRVNARMFEKGEGTKTDMLETQAQFDLGEAQLIQAQDSLTDARNVLSAMVGREITALDALREDFAVKPLRPAGFDEWKVIALERNPEILAQRHALEIASQEINKNRSGHFPRLDAIASISNTSSDTINTYNQDAKIHSIGLQLNVPLYSGGYINALTSQSVSNYQKAQADLDAKTNQVLIDLRKNFSLVSSSAQHINALVKSVGSARLLVDAMQKSIKGGLRTNFDVLNAQRQLFASKRDLSRARYSYLLGYLRLRQAAGVLDARDLQEIAGHFVVTQQ